MSIWDRINPHNIQVPINVEYFEAGPTPVDPNTGQELPKAMWPAQSTRYLCRIVALRNSANNDGVPNFVLDAEVVASENPSAVGRTLSHVTKLDQYVDNKLGRIVGIFHGLLNGLQGAQWTVEQIANPLICKWITAEDDSQCPPQIAQWAAQKGLPASQPCRGLFALVRCFSKQGQKYANIDVARVDDPAQYANMPAAPHWTRQGQTPQQAQVPAQVPTQAQPFNLPGQTPQQAQVPAQVPTQAQPFNLPGQTPQQAQVPAQVPTQAQPFNLPGQTPQQAQVPAQVPTQAQPFNLPGQTPQQAQVPAQVPTQAQPFNLPNWPNS